MRTGSGSGARPFECKTMTTTIAIQIMTSVRISVVRVILLVESTLAQDCDGIVAIMLAMMTSDAPLPTPYSVISSL